MYTCTQTTLLFFGLSMMGCSAGFDKEGSNIDPSIQDTSTPSAEPESDTATESDTAAESIDASDQDRMQNTTTCSGGGFVQGDGISGAICISTTDIIAPESTSQSETYTWYVGPTRTVSP